MNILVTGGAGFIGSHICDALLDRGDCVVCVDNFDSYYDPAIKEKNIKQCLLNSNFELYKVDVRDFEKLGKIFEKEKIDKIVHLAAKAGVRASFENQKEYFDVNVNGTKNLLELAVRHKIKNFVFGSSSSVYGVNKKVPFSEDDKADNQISPYAESKRKAELLCKDFHDKNHLNVTCLRFFTVYGPRGRPDMAPYKFTKIISDGKEIEMYGDGTTKRDYTYIKDIINGVVSALDKDFGFEIINLGDSNTVELTYFIKLIEKNVGKKAKIKKMPMQKGDVPVTYADITKARRLLGYEPKVKIEEGIKLFVDWFKRQR